MSSSDIIRKGKRNELTQQRHALVVLGMHRSGTSALARVLSFGGAQLPTNLLIADKSDPHDSNTTTGFWESSAILLLHEEALASAGTTWDNPFGVQSSWFESSSAKEITNQLVATLRQEFGDAPLFVAKDPRICLFTPLWKSAFSRLGIRAHWLISVRDPLEVAASLGNRNGLPVHTSLLVWLKYFLDAEKHTRADSRSFVRYDDLLDNWREVVARIERDSSLILPRRAKREAAKVDRFLNSQLRHHFSPTDEVDARDDIGTWIKATYRWARDESSGKPQNPKKLDDLRRTVARAEELYRPIFENLLHKTMEQEELTENRRTGRGETVKREKKEVEMILLEVDRLSSENARLAHTAQLLESRTEDRERAIDAKLETMRAEISGLPRKDEVLEPFLAEFREATARIAQLEAENSRIRIGSETYKLEAENLKGVCSEQVRAIRLLEERHERLLEESRIDHAVLGQAQENSSRAQEMVIDLQGQLSELCRANERYSMFVSDLELSRSWRLLSTLRRWVGRAW